MGPNRRAFQMTLISMITSITSTLDDCFCSAQFDPVCATNGEVFTNECMLKCYNSENHSSLEVEKAGHCDHFKVGGGQNLVFPLENSAVGGATDVCLFTKDYNERFLYVGDPGEQNVRTGKEKARKSKHYLCLLVILCAIECAVLILTQMFLAKHSQPRPQPLSL